MTKMETEALAERIIAMSAEEKQFILKLIPTDYLSNELDRRCNSASRMIKGMNKLLSSVNKESSLEEMQAAIVKMKEVLN